MAPGPSKAEAPAAASTAGSDLNRALQWINEMLRPPAAVTSSPMDRAVLDGVVSSE